MEDDRHGKQNSAGHDVSRSVKLDSVKHKYRAVAGTKISPSVAFGLGQVTPKSTGLSAVHFNTNEGAAVNTRNHYFEGEFSMTASSEGCSDVGVADNKPLKSPP